MKEEKKKETEPIVTCRILFISVLDKILLIGLGLLFIIFTGLNLDGYFVGYSAGFGEKLGVEFALIIGFTIALLFYDWLYRCATKTMLCVTKNEIYKETYYPLVRIESTIPLNKVTQITTRNVLWIFRAVIIHQYMGMPKIFFTWNNQEFKDAANELITGEKNKIKNDAKEKSLITKKVLFGIGIFLAIVLAIMILSGIFSFIKSLFNPEKKLYGEYEAITTSYNGSSNNKYKGTILIKKDHECSIESEDIEKLTECSWEYNDNNKTLTIDYTYEYEYEYGYYYTYTTTRTTSDTLYLKYDKKDKTLTNEYENIVFKKQ